MSHDDITCLHLTEKTIKLILGYFSVALMKFVHVMTVEVFDYLIDRKFHPNMQNT